KIRVNKRGGRRRWIMRGGPAFLPLVESHRTQHAWLTRRHPPVSTRSETAHESWIVVGQAQRAGGVVHEQRCPQAMVAPPAQRPPCAQEYGEGGDHRVPQVARLGGT